jgi:hypothetical protein
MNKTELIDAIQQVITPNGKKAISAESLANLLIEMVNATPEGGNGGSGQVVFYAGVPNEGTTELYLTPEQKAHNAEMFKVVKESPVAISATLDITEYYKVMMETESGIEIGEMKCGALGNCTYYLTPESAILVGLDVECIAFDSLIPMGVLADGSTMFLGI